MQTLTLNEAIKAHIAAVDAFYRPVLLAAQGRLTGCDRLMAGLEQAVAAYHKTGRRQVSGVIERVNELVVAKRLLDDPALARAVIAYEPEMIAGGPRFDFVVRRAGLATVFVEVKTVSPHPDADGASWRKATYRGRAVEPRGDDGGAAVQAALARYWEQTARKLAAHVAVEPGIGVLVACGDGIGWDVSAVAAFVREGRNGLAGIGVMMRAQAALEAEVWLWPLRA